MATRNEEVMEMVRRELERQPDIPLAELYERAQEIDPSVAELSTRQFHAKYPLQIKRARGAGGRAATRRQPRRRKTAAPTTQQRTERQPRQRQQRQETGAPNRDAIRSVFLQFASDFAQAESRTEIVGVLSNLDGYVDQVVKLASRS